MDLLTAKEVAIILKASESYVYQNKALFGGMKLGGVIRFDKEVFFKKLQEAAHGTEEASREMAIRVHERGNKVFERRISDQARCNSGRTQGKESDREDKYGLRKIVRESLRGGGTTQD